MNSVMIFITVVVKVAILLINKAVGAAIKTVDEE